MSCHASLLVFYQRLFNTLGCFASGVAVALIALVFFDAAPYCLIIIGVGCLGTALLPLIDDDISIFERCLPNDLPALVHARTLAALKRMAACAIPQLLIGVFHAISLPPNHSAWAWQFLAIIIGILPCTVVTLEWIRPVRARASPLVQFMIPPAVCAVLMLVMIVLWSVGQVFGPTLPFIFGLAISALIPLLHPPSHFVEMEHGCHPSGLSVDLSTEHTPDRPQVTVTDSWFDRIWSRLLAMLPLTAQRTLIWEAPWFFEPWFNWLVLAPLATISSEFLFFCLILLGCDLARESKQKLAFMSLSITGRQKAFLSGVTPALLCSVAVVLWCSTLREAPVSSRTSADELHSRVKVHGRPDGVSGADLRHPDLERFLDEQQARHLQRTYGLIIAPGMDADQVRLLSTAAQQRLAMVSGLAMILLAALVMWWNLPPRHVVQKQSRQRLINARRLIAILVFFLPLVTYVILNNRSHGSIDLPPGMPFPPVPLGISGHVLPIIQEYALLIGCALFVGTLAMLYASWRNVRWIELK